MKLQNLLLLLFLTVTLLLAKRHTTTPPQSQFSQVVDLSSNDTRIQLPQQRPVPAERLVAPVAVLDVTPECAATACSLSMEAVGRWEAAHGPVPAGALVLVSAPEKHTIVITPETARFLTEARMVFGFGVGDAGFDGDAATTQDIALKGVYRLSGLVEISQAPAAGAIAVVAPQLNAQSSDPAARVFLLVPAPSSM